MDTHTKYGACAAPTHLWNGQTAMTDQMIVAQTITMSTAASGTLLSPEKIGMNNRLATRLMAKGMTTSWGIWP